MRRCSVAARQAAAAPASLPASNEWSEEFTRTATLDEHQAQFFSERDRSIDSQPLSWIAIEPEGDNRRTSQGNIPGVNHVLSPMRIYSKRRIEILQVMWRESRRSTTGGSHA
jgi:hypothetical protein